MFGAPLAAPTCKCRASRPIKHVITHSNWRNERCRDWRNFIIQPGGYPTNIWSNNNANSGPLKARTSEDLLAAYPALTAGMGERTGGGSTDPMDVPRAIADIIAMPKGKRPLRKAVHPVARPQESVNAAAAEAQLAMLGESQLGPWIKDVLER